jgi:hypothetical protein
MFAIARLGDFFGRFSGNFMAQNVRYFLWSMIISTGIRQLQMQVVHLAS